MKQRTAALTAPTLLRHARRALLVVGGALIWWLVFLAGGAAHADASSHADQHARQQHAPAVDAPGLVSRTGRAVTGILRTTPAQVTKTLTSATTTAPDPVRAAVQTVAADVEPTLAGTTTALADTVDTTADATTALVAPTLQQAGLSGRSGPGADTATPLASAHAGRAPGAATSHLDHAQASVRTMALWSSPETTPSAQQPTRPPGNQAPSSGGRPSTPSLPGGGSASGAGGPGMLSGFLVLPLTLDLRRRALGDAAVPSGPAYSPGSSPD